MKYFIILREFGLKWVIYRILYSLKLSILKKYHKLDFIFEKEVSIKRIDLFKFNVNKLEEFLLQLSSAEQNKIIQSADRAIEGKIKGFSSINLDYGFPINWHNNPILNKGYDKTKKWFEIPDFDKNVGDIKVIWEISRFTHLQFFSRAYIITKERKYYQAFIDQLRDWLNENPYSYGPNYKCGQEATIRMLNILFAYSIFNEYEHINDIDKKIIKSIVKDSYKKVRSNFFYAHKCLKNNHTFTEILGKIIGAWAEDDKKNLEKSVKLMNDEIEMQFADDGGFKQYSNNYHRFVLQILGVVLMIEPIIGYSIKDKERIYKSNMLLLNMMNKYGYLPNYGSNDGALIFLLSNADFRDYRSTVGALHALLMNEQLFDFDLHTEEALWFHGNNLEKAIVKQEPIKAQKTGHYSFKDEKSFLLVHLNDLKSRPAHMDQLHIDFWYKDKEVFCDLGTYSYASNIGYTLSLNENHNTVSVENKTQMDKTGAFMTYNRTILKNVEYEINKKFVGTIRSRNGYKHTRKILKTSYGFQINDIVDNDKYYIVFNTPLEVKVVGNEIMIFKNESMFVKLNTEHKIYIYKQYRSLYYYKKEEINQIVIKVEKKGKAKTDIVLVSEYDD